MPCLSADRHALWRRLTASYPRGGDYNPGGERGYQTLLLSIREAIHNICRFAIMPALCRSIRAGRTSEARLRHQSSAAATHAKAGPEVDKYAILNRGLVTNLGEVTSLTERECRRLGGGYG